MWRFLPALFVLLLFAGAVALFWPSEQESIGHTVRFSDGTAMTLKAVTHGTEHRYLGGGPWQRLPALLPRKLVAKFVSSQGVMTLGRPSVVFWFARVGKGPITGDPQLVLCDVTGFGVSGGSSVMRSGAPGNWIEGWAYEYWPRRERTFTLCVY